MLKIKFSILILLFCSGCATAKSYDNGAVERMQGMKENQENLKNQYDKLRTTSNFMFFWQRWNF
jgi:outer membrane lipoprotein-sorting protein